MAHSRRARHVSGKRVGTLRFGRPTHLSSSISEVYVMELESCGVLDTPLSRSTTISVERRSYPPNPVSLRIRHYNTASTAFAISAVPLRPPNSIGLIPSA